MFLARVIQSPTPAERQVLASQRTRTCCLRRNGTSRPLRRHGFRGSILHPMHSLCTLHLSRRRLTCNTHYRAGATPYPGGTFTRWNTPAFPGAPVSPSRPDRSTDAAHSGGQGWPKAIAKRRGLDGCEHGSTLASPAQSNFAKKGLDQDGYSKDRTTAAAAPADRRAWARASARAPGDICRCAPDAPP